jgi:hypothetical protein
MRFYGGYSAPRGKEPVFCERGIISKAKSPLPKLDGNFRGRLRSMDTSLPASLFCRTECHQTHSPTFLRLLTSTAETGANSVHREH